MSIHLLKTAIMCSIMYILFAIPNHNICIRAAWCCQNWYLDISWIWCFLHLSRSSMLLPTAYLHSFSGNSNLQICRQVAPEPRRSAARIWLRRAHGVPWQVWTLAMTMGGLGHGPHGRPRGIRTLGAINRRFWDYRLLGCRFGMVWFPWVVA